MHASLTNTIDYKAVAADLEAKIKAGQAQFEAWEKQRQDLEATLAGVKKLIASESHYGLPIFGSSPKVLVADSVIEDSGFKGLTYREAVIRCFRVAGKPIGPPDVADMLLEAGYDDHRPRIKNNVDSTFYSLRQKNTVKRVDGGKYILA